MEVSVWFLEEKSFDCCSVFSGLFVKWYSCALNKN